MVVSPAFSAAEGVAKFELSSEKVYACFLNACLLDVEALKPGNVSVGRGGHGMVAADFKIAARASAAAIAKADMTLGEKILAAVEDTRKVVSENVNLGIILACAPLAQATLYRKPDVSFRLSLAKVLSETTVRDAKLVYEAIRLANPGGMGTTSEQDLASEPTITLVEVMKLARKRDAIAAQYANGYREVFNVVVPALLEFHSQWGYHPRALTYAYLETLAKLPDSLIARKYGRQRALEVGARAAAALAKLRKRELCALDFEFLVDMDAAFKNAGINPGTTADLLLAGVFITSIGFYAGCQWGIAWTELGFKF